ncbi:hypothetical protein NHQ30_000165 [Ciborinia camelliae]|nr:hypothetical protein NHQ30_000165 [Ciborinia camelliae]
MAEKSSDGERTVAELCRTPEVIVIVGKNDSKAGCTTFREPGDLLERFSKACTEDLKKYDMEDVKKVHLPQGDPAGFKLALDWMHLNFLTIAVNKTSSLKPSSRQFYEKGDSDEDRHITYPKAIYLYVKFFEAAEILGLVGCFEHVEQSLEATLKEAMQPERYQKEIKGLITEDTIATAFNPPAAVRSSVRKLLAKAFVRPYLQETFSLRLVNKAKQDKIDRPPFEKLLETYEGLAKEIFALTFHALRMMSFTTVVREGVSLCFKCPLTKESFVTSSQFAVAVNPLDVLHYTPQEQSWWVENCASRYPFHCAMTLDWLVSTYVGN